MNKTVKQLLCILLLFATTLSLFACQGNFSAVNLKEAITLSGEGNVDKETLAQIQRENAVCVFKGKFENTSYEWTLFGSAIQEVRPVKLGIEAKKAEDGGISVSLLQEEAFGFSATLSIYLNEKWDEQSATAYQGDKAFATVAVTGRDQTILNVSLDGSEKSFVIKANPEEVFKPDAEEKKEEAQNQTEAGTPPQSEIPAETTKAESPSLPPKTSATPTKTTAKPENGGKDKYFTDPVPEGKPNPVEPEDQEIDKEITYTCTFSIECSTILNNLQDLEPNKLEAVPHDGVILKKTVVTFWEGESVFDVLQRVCKEMGIHMEASWTPMYNSAYVEGIHNLYEFDCGALSGWMYKVNGWYPNYGSSRYQLQEGDLVEWRYTCDLGNDIGGGYAIGG